MMMMCLNNIELVYSIKTQLWHNVIYIVARVYNRKEGDIILLIVVIFPLSVCIGLIVIIQSYPIVSVSLSCGHNHLCVMTRVVWFVLVPIPALSPLLLSGFCGGIVGSPFDVINIR